MIEDINEFSYMIKKTVAERMDLTRNIEDDEVKDIINDVIREKSKESYISLTDKKELFDRVLTL